MQSQQMETGGAARRNQERRRLWALGRELLQPARERGERLEGARLVTRAMALPPGVELDESLCRRAGIPPEWLEELRQPEAVAA